MTEKLKAYEIKSDETLKNEMVVGLLHSAVWGTVVISSVYMVFVA